VGLTQSSNCESYDPTYSWLARIWGDEQKIEGAFAEALMALRELEACRLYRSTHECFSQYLIERFGWFQEEIYPSGSELST
jgi:hypothetical protein